MRQIILAFLLLCAGTVAGTLRAAELTDMATVTAAFAHTCALGRDGSVKCWGRGNFGQLGDGSGLSQPFAVDVDLGGGARDVSAGEFHTCAAMIAGGVKCWGQNYYGQDGDNSRTPRLKPVEVMGLAAPATAVAVGSAHSCALLTTGRVQCWGSNAKGQLGDGTTTDKLLPVNLLNLDNVVAISAGSLHTCALTQAGTVACWGFNDYGQLGNNTRVTSTVPVMAAGLAGATAISAGYGHTCALVGLAKPKCWGLNDAGQVGDTTGVGRLAPVDVAILGTGTRAISAGKSHTCAITQSQAVACWGSNGSGESAISFGSLPEPTIAIAAGTQHTCAVGISGAVRCSGSNADGQLGVGGSPFRIAPVAVVGLDASVVQVVAGSSYSCALNAAGGVLCWGGATRVDNSRDPLLLPAPVPGLSSGVASLAAGSGHACALTIAGGVRCWGGNGAGQLGNGLVESTSRAVPVDVIGLGSGVVAITAGGTHTCALTAGGGVKCWGSNASGQIGDGTIAPSRTVPVDVVGLPTGVAAVSAGGSHTCAITVDGTVRCWGANTWGQLGDGTTTAKPVPQLVLAGGVRAIAAAGSHTCAILASGSVRCWGANYLGQLGTSSVSNTSAGEVIGITNATAIAAGYDQTCVLTAIGQMQCWGNTGALFGTTPFGPRGVPLTIVGLAPGIKSMAVGGSHACAVTPDNRAACWGGNFSSQVGDGTTSQYNTAVAVVAAPERRVVEFYNAALDSFFVTADLYEGYAVDLGGAGPSWVRTGGSFKAGGNFSVCRFYGSVSPGPNSHFYTVDPFECAVLRSRQLAANDPRRLTEKSWNFESYDFRSTPPLASGSCAAGTEPIYRAYNNGSVRGIDSNHRLSRDSNAIIELVRRGWVSEGVKMCAPV